ncbi:AAA family ATPase [Bosea sp. ASV33]|uniref:AAA family ATPase n=1 Tax=Bosea sp. ASV33 TaxID=2795106 RepID=UPI0018ECDC19|nr:AAA family ATPase [Bosea sp. ASV33]
MISRRSLDSRYRDASAVLARSLITRALRRADLRHFLLGQPGIVGVIVPEVDAESYVSTATLMLKPRGTAYDGDVEVIHFDGVPPKRGFRTQAETFKDVLPKSDRIIGVASRESDIPDAFRRIADAIVVVDPVDITALQGVCATLLGRIPSDAELAPAIGAPLHILGAAIKRGRNAGWALRRLRGFVAAASTPNPTPNISRAGPMLSELHGYGAAREWGHALAADLADYRAGVISWAEVDRGIVLVGAPGVGKTIFGFALGRTCNVPVFAHSLAQWQATGYLNDVIKAMRAAFAEALRNAPSLLIVDELDSFGDRERLSGHSENYCREVINAFLECLDGGHSREGVVVIGTTNLIEKVDRAILRPGRLERQVNIPLPDALAREGILRHHLRGDLPDADLLDVSERLEGTSGAGIEQLVRDARRRARSELRPLITDDLVASLPARVRLSEAAFRRACIHEAGHAVAGHVLRQESSSTPVEAKVFREVRDGACGRTNFDNEFGAERTKAFHLARITVLLAGLAAEQIVLGEHGDGGGGEEPSDLHSATMLAASLDLSYGLGQGLAYLSSRKEEALAAWLRGDPQLRRRVEADLDVCFRRAQDVLTKHRRGVEEIATALAALGSIGREDIARIVDQRSTELCPENCRIDVNSCATMSRSARQ